MDATNAPRGCATAAVPGLRATAEKWLRPAGGTRLSVKVFGRMGTGLHRYVGVVSRGVQGERVMFFFLHDDGSWCVFPQQEHGPEMSTHLFAA